MSRELRGALVLFVLMIAIWAIVIAMSRSTLWYIVLAGAIWATADFARAFWAWFLVRTNPAEEDDFS
jgi:hypothetical protein